MDSTLLPPLVSDLCVFYDFTTSTGKLFVKWLNNFYQNLCLIWLLVLDYYFEHHCILSHGLYYPKLLMRKKTKKYIFFLSTLWYKLYCLLLQNMSTQSKNTKFNTWLQLDPNTTQPYSNPWVFWLLTVPNPGRHKNRATCPNSKWDQCSVKPLRTGHGLDSASGLQSKDHQSKQSEGCAPKSTRPQLQQQQLDQMEESGTEPAQNLLRLPYPALDQPRL